jgi:hypothetical protein
VGAEAALAKRDMPRATELLGDPDTCHAYSARLRGEEWRPRGDQKGGGGG